MPEAAVSKRGVRDTRAISYRARCDVGMAASQTVIVSEDLVGFDDDYFNTGWEVLILLNADAAGTAPEGEERDVVNYVSASGTLTCQSFSGNVEENDWFIIVRSVPTIPIPHPNQGLSYIGQCDPGMAGSLNTIISANLAGYGDDFFNLGYVMQIIFNNNSHGNPPEDEWQDITNYSSATGTFTTNNFAANVEAGDWILVVRRELWLTLTIRASGDFVFYLAAEDLGTTEMTDDGTDPLLLAEVSQANANEAAGEAAPAWTEDYNLDQAGTLTLISIFGALRWRMKRTGGTVATAKWQISGDGGANWQDLTENVTEAGAVYVDKLRVGEGLWITTITGGVNQLQVRLCAWTDGASVETRVRAGSYLRLSYRKS